MSLILSPFFGLHDFLTTLASKHMVLFKRLLLLAAHLIIFGFFFPDLRKFFGELAFNLLLLLLVLSPVSKILRMRLLLIGMTYRRQLGILMAYLAAVHAIGYLSDPLFFEGVIAHVNFFSIDPRYLAGIFAYLLTLPLLFTSNDFAMKHLGKNWKRLHFLVYLLFILAVFHKFTVGRGFGDIGAIIQALIVIGLYILLKWWAYRGLPVFLENIRVYIANKYHLYTTHKKSL